MTIIQDFSKFAQFAQFDMVDIHHSTISIEAKFQKLPVKLVKSGALPSSIIELIRPTGFVRLRLYSLPIIHKDGDLLRPITIEGHYNSIK